MSTKKQIWGSKYGNAIDAYTKTEADALLSAKQNSLGFTAENAANKGNANGYPELNESEFIPSAQLPSYVDDVLEYADFASLPATGETGKSYITLDDNKQWRWSGTAYVQIDPGLALGETSATAYRGDRGKTAYDHSQTTHDKAFVGLGNVDNTSDANKPISDATQTALNGKLANVVEDTTPQLGGELDAQAHSIGFTLTDNGNSGTSKTIDWRNSNIQKITLTGDCTLTFTAPSKPGGLTLIVTQDGTGGRNLTLPATCKLLGSAITFTAGGISKSIILSFKYDGTNYWYQGTSWEA